MITQHTIKKIAVFTIFFSVVSLKTTASDIDALHQELGELMQKTTPDARVERRINEILNVLSSINNEDIAKQTAAMAEIQKGKEQAWIELQKKRSEHLDATTAADLSFQEHHARLALEKDERDEFQKFPAEFIPGRDKIAAKDLKRQQIMGGGGLAQLQIQKEERNERGKIMRQMTSEGEEILKREASAPKLKIVFPGDHPLEIPRSVASLIPAWSRLGPTEDLKISNIKPSIMKHICDFLRAAATISSQTKKSLADPASPSKYKYALFEREPNLLKFVKKNMELIDALKKLDLWREVRVTEWGDRYRSSFSYAYVDKDNVHNLILHQTFIASGFRDGNTEHPLTTVDGVLNELQGVPDDKSIFMDGPFGTLMTNISHGYAVRILGILKKMDHLDYDDFVEIVNRISNDSTRYDTPSQVAQTLPLMSAFARDFAKNNRAFFERIRWRGFDGIIRAHTNNDETLRAALQNEYERADRPQAQAPGENALYFRGVDVHNSDRDDRSTQAIRTFLASQKGVTVDFTDYYNNFVENIDTVLDRTIQAATDRNQQKKDASNQITIQRARNNKTKIRQVLGLPGVLRLDGYGVLLAHRMTSYGLDQMDPKEFLGRLWYFVSNIKDPADRENAELSMMNGIADSVETDNHIVCNPGKLQRMIVGILQGRVEGVDIEHLESQSSLSDSEKNAVEGAMLNAYKTTGGANPDAVLRKLNVVGAKERATKDYIATRKAMIAAMQSKPAVTSALGREYASREEAGTAIDAILAQNTDIAGNPFLRAYLIDSMMSLVKKP